MGGCRGESTKALESEEIEIREDRSLALLYHSEREMGSLKPDLTFEGC